MSEEKTKEYWHGLAALRAIAMLLGVALHSAVPYLSRPLTGLVWATSDDSSGIADIVFWWIHSWRIPFFFFLSGFFALQTIERRGIEEFFRRRMTRLVVPYLAAICTIGPCVYIVFVCGWALTGQCTWEQALPWVSLPSVLSANSFGPAHLWFLLELIILSVSLTCIWMALTPSTVQANMRTVTRIKLSWWFPVIGGLLATALLWSDPAPLLNWDNTFFCIPSRLLYHATYFIGGVIAYRHRQSFFEVTSYYRRHLIICIPLSISYLCLINSSADLTVGWPCLAISMTSGLMCWLMIYGCIGLFNKVLHRSSQLVQYLADSSYWVYLLHLPVVAAFHIAIRDVPISSALKFVVVNILTTAVCLMTYQFAVRYTLIGRWLHGERLREPEVVNSTSEIPAAQNA